MEAETTEVWIWSFLSESSASYRCEAAVAAASERAYKFVRVANCASQGPLVRKRHISFPSWEPRAGGFRRFPDKAF